MDTREFFRLLQRRWATITVFVLVGVIGALILTFTQTPKYNAESKVFVSTTSASSVQDLTQGTTFTQAVLKSYADVATTPIVLDQVAKADGVTRSPTLLATEVTADAPADSAVLTISATDSSASQAAAIANAVSKTLSDVVDQLTPTAGGAASVKVTQIQQAVQRSTPVSPRPLIDILAGLAIGLVVGLAAAILHQRLDTRVRGAAAIKAEVDKPFVGGILYDEDAAVRPLVSQFNRHGARAEAFKTLRANLQFLTFKSTATTLVVTSSVQGEGKSTTAVNLAISLADAGVKTLLIDADLRRPTAAHYLGVVGEVGLTDVLVGRTELTTAVQSWGDSGRLSVLPAGAVPPNPSEMIQSRQMESVLEELRTEYEYIIIDTPPILPVADAAILGRQADGALLICASGRTRKGQLRESVSRLTQAGADVLGLVGTFLPTKGADSYGYGYGAYGYTYAPAPDLSTPVDQATPDPAPAPAPAEEIDPAHVG